MGSRAEWVRSDDPTPQGHIRLSEAFDLYYRTITPSWQELDAAVCAADAARGGKFVEKTDAPLRSTAFNAHKAREVARAAADQKFRATLTAGDLRPLIRDPANGALLELSRNGWAAKAMSDGGFSRGFDEDFVEPGDLFQPGPLAAAGGYLRPVFFEQRHFSKWLIAAGGGSCGARRGPKPKYDRAMIRDLVRTAMEFHGRFSPDDPDWKVQADLERHVQSELELLGRSPSESRIRKLIEQPLAEWTAEKAAEGL